MVIQEDTGTYWPSSNKRKIGYVDEVSFGRKENTIERTPPAFVNTAIKLEEVIVNVTSDSLIINVSI